MQFLTIFTPTYNRAHILKELYVSLCAQTNMDFIWSIVDDGSSDETSLLVRSWIDEGVINIKYQIQENQGKHIAHNMGLETCDTELFFCVDSDDRLTNDAVQTIRNLNDEESGNDILGFVMRRGDFSGRPTGKNWPVDVKYAFFNDLYEKYGYKGETAIILKKEPIKRCRFPKFDNERFLRESVFYDQMNGIAPLRLDNRVCYLFAYMKDGYTAQGKLLEYRNPIGTGYKYLIHIDATAGFVRKSKFMGMFYAWVDVMHISDPIYDAVHIPLLIRAVGRILKKHYARLFTAQKMKYELLDFKKGQIVL